MNGDWNIKFYHVYHSKGKKKKKNPISQVADIHGVLDLMSPALQICLLNLDLFTSSTPSQIDIYLFALNHKGTDQMNAILCQPFTAEEVKSAFFRWDLIKPLDQMAMVHVSININGQHCGI